VVNKGLCE